MSGAVLLREQADLAGAEAAADWRMAEDVFFTPQPPYCSLSRKLLWQLTLTLTDWNPRGGGPDPTPQHPARDPSVSVVRQ